MKEVMNGKYGDNFLGSKDLIYQPVMSMFSWTVSIQFFPKSGRFPPRAHSCYSYYWTMVFHRLLFGAFYIALKSNTILFL